MCVRTLGIVGSRTQLSLRCNFSDYLLRNNYMFRPMMVIFRLSWEYPRPLKPLPHHSTTKKNRKQRTQDFTPGSIPPQHLQFFIYRLSWVVVYLSITCLTLNYLYFLFRYALLYFSIHSGVHFELFFICDLFSVCFICALSHTC